MFNLKQRTIIRADRLPHLKKLCNMKSPVLKKNFAHVKYTIKKIPCNSRQSFTVKIRELLEKTLTKENKIWLKSDSKINTGN